MFCVKCGNRLSDDVVFCQICGTKVKSYEQQNKEYKEKTKYESKKKTFDTECMTQKEGLELINNWLASQKIIVEKSFFKTFIVGEMDSLWGPVVNRLRITYAEFTYHTSGNGKRYMVDAITATRKVSLFGGIKNSANEMIEDAQKISEEQHPGAKVERVFDRQVIVRGSIPFQTRVILYSYPNS